jgi:hypothetical protein
MLIHPPAPDELLDPPPESGKAPFLLIAGLAVLGGLARMLEKSEELPRWTLAHYVSLAAGVFFLYTLWQFVAVVISRI